MRRDWDQTWQRIVALEGETFHQKRGKPFQYKIQYGMLHPTTTNHQLARSQFEKALERMPLDGPGGLQDLRGPSYLWAILSDTRVSGESETSNATPPPLTILPPTPEVSGAQVLPGTQVTIDELNGLAFLPLKLEFKEPVELEFGQIGRNWNTLGEIPNGPGIYAFTVESNRELRVTYVGMTTHLWMVTLGREPGGGGRGGQRYGRPKHAGVTRERINVLVAEQVRMGRVVTHWVRPVEEVAELRLQEEQLIARWNLRLAGWNRG